MQRVCSASVLLALTLFACNDTPVGGDATTCFGNSGLSNAQRSNDCCAACNLPAHLYCIEQ